MRQEQLNIFEKISLDVSCQNIEQWTSHIIVFVYILKFYIEMNSKKANNKG